jgi:hypothetical protein
MRSLERAAACDIARPQQRGRFATSRPSVPWEKLDGVEDFDECHHNTTGVQGPATPQVQNPHRIDAQKVRAPAERGLDAEPQPVASA